MGKVKDRMVKLTGEGADAQYLTWNQVPIRYVLKQKHSLIWLMICQTLQEYHLKR